MRLRTDQHHMKMGGGSGKRDHGHPPGRQTHGNRGKIAYGTGNMDSWRDDDMRVALIVLLIATAWIAILIRKRQGKDTWLDRIVGNIGFGLGNSSAPGFSSLDELVGALKDAGVTSAGLIVGVDFTRSNEWTGQKVYGGKNMHDINGPEPNPYQEVLKGVGRGLGPLNRGDQIWCYGFGDVNTRDESVFCFMPNDEPCGNLDQAMTRYENIAPAVELSGPTSFAPLIRKAIEIVEDGGRQYHCLVIIADGQVTKEGDTVKAIQDASSYPLSIIMIGVGEGPWDTCRVFDNRLHGRRFDNFRFVEHRCLKRGDAQALALSALAEVPDQYRAIRRLGLISGSEGASHPMADLAMTGGGTGGMAPGMAGGHIGGGGSGQPSVSPSAPSSEYDQDEDVPKEYLCPLTLEVMMNPVVCEDGHSYERRALEAWLQNHNTSPMSNARLSTTMVVPNHALRNSIETFRQKRGY